MTYEEIVHRRRNFNISGTGDKYKTLAEVDFDGPWITPYQKSSCSPTGPILVAYHWFDVPSVNKHRQILKEKGYKPDITFNKVVDHALKIVGKTRRAIYITQAFHLLPSTRSALIEREHLNPSFNEITRHELEGRRVVALGNEVARVCKHFRIEHQAVVHPSARHLSIENKAQALAAAIRG